MKRREFLKKTITSSAALLAGTQLIGCAPEQKSCCEQLPKNFDPCQSITLGKSEIKVTRLGFGTGMKGGRGESNLTRLGKERCEAVIRHGYDNGVRFFDCADIYGTHPYVIPAMKSIPRQDYIVSSKIWLRQRRDDQTQAPDVETTIARFLKELKTDYIDILQIHCLTDARWNTQLSSQMETLDKLKKKGLIRTHGVSVHSLDALKTAAAEPWVDIVHVRINAYGTKMDGPVEQVVPVIQNIHAAGKGVIGMKLIGEGDFRDSDEKINKSIEYVMNLGCVDNVVVGFEAEQEIDNYQQRMRNTKIIRRQRRRFRTV